jgi:hypothetical protein
MDGPDLATYYGFWAFDKDPDSDDVLEREEFKQLVDFLFAEYRQEFTEADFEADLW